MSAPSSLINLLVIGLCIFVAISIIAAVFLGSGLADRSSSTKSCPNCGGHKIGRVAKEPQGMRDVSGGFNSNWDYRGTVARVIYIEKYRCNDCQHGWEKRVEE